MSTTTLNQTSRSSIINAPSHATHNDLDTYSPYSAQKDTLDRLTPPSGVSHKRPERVKKIATITPPSSQQKKGHIRNISESHMLDSQVQVTPRSPTNELNPI